MPSPRVFTEHDHVIRLRDGRVLGYAEYGDPDGAPVISCHGGLTSRLDAAPGHDEAARQGVRLISPDRPGIGLSDRRPGRTLLDWSQDVSELADALAIDRFAIMGWSLGGDYAAGCAHQLGDRITAAALVSTGTPDDWPHVVGELAGVDRVLLALARRAPSVDRAAFRMIGESASRLPRVFRRGAGAAADALRRAVVEGMHDTRGVVDEYHIVGAALAFDPAEITVPVMLWHGEDDDIVKPSWARAFAARIPGSTLTTVPGADHYLWYDHWEPILTALREAASSPS